MLYPRGSPRQISPVFETSGGNQACKVTGLQAATAIHYQNYSTATLDLQETFPKSSNLLSGQSEHFVQAKYASQCKMPGSPIRRFAFQYFHLNLIPYTKGFCLFLQNHTCNGAVLKSRPDAFFDGLQRPGTKQIQSKTSATGNPRLHWCCW